MTIAPEAVVIGLTGPFGSGCSEAASYIQAHREFHKVRLSEVLREAWKGEDGPTREDLQAAGDTLRKERGNGAIAETAVDALARAETLYERIVIDGIRNLGEIQVLRETFGYNFYLVAVLASAEDRWDRIGHTQYLENDLSQAQFFSDDARDRDEDADYGQQVQLCVDDADVFIDNTGAVGLPLFHEKLLEYSDLITGDSARYAKPDEVMMHMAFSASHSSKCLKRHVGAVLVDDRGDVLGVGYNENPTGTNPCVLEASYGHRCYRDIVRDEAFTSMVSQAFCCPICKEPVPEIAGPPWECANCASHGNKTDLASVFFPDRAMSWCTAIHAEVRAILSAHGTLSGSTLYTTTFPCFQCAEKIIQVGVRRIVFTEVYPDIKAADRLDLAGIDYEQFEGVRSSVFERIFARPV